MTEILFVNEPAKTYPVVLADADSGGVSFWFPDLPEVKAGAPAEIKDQDLILSMAAVALDAALKSRQRRRKLFPFRSNNESLTRRGYKVFDVPTTVRARTVKVIAGDLAPDEEASDEDFIELEK